MGDDDATDALRPGETLGRYAIVRRLGGGAMGEVYEARHADLDKRVAIKVMKSAASQAAEARVRFLREGQAAARVRHPHAVDISDVGAEGNVLYLVMEYLEGEDLAALLKREAPLTTERVADLMLPVAAALAAVHEEGIVHRDLKPANIFVARTRQGAPHPKILDFGVSKVSAPKGGVAITSGTDVLGTPLYMSPEQTRASREVDARSDVYSLGAILYECATGRRAIQGANVTVIFQRIGDGEFPRPRAVAPALSEAFEALILRAMATRPADRFPTMNDLGRALLPFASAPAQVLWSPVFGMPVSDTALDAALRSSPRVASPERAVPAPRAEHGTATAAVVTGDEARSKLPWVIGGVVALFIAVGGFVVTLRYLDESDGPAATAPSPRRTPAAPSDAAAPTRDTRATTDAGAASDAGTTGAAPASEGERGGHVRHGTRPRHRLGAR